MEIIILKKIISGRPDLIPQMDLTPKQEKPEFLAFAEMERILSTAASQDAIKIFYAAKDGINSSTQSMQELGLTPKKYYTHLKNLLETGLVEKTEVGYQHTALGKICYRLMEALKSVLGQRERLELVDKVCKIKNISARDSDEIMQAILKDVSLVSGERITDILGPVRMADSWEKVVEDVIEYVEKSKENIYFATQYLDMKVIEACFGAMERGVKMSFLVNDKDQISKGIRFIFHSLLTNPKALKSLFQMFSSPNLQVRCIEMPYTFIIIDGKYAMVEVVKPFTKTFSLAFFFQNERLCERMAESFHRLWEKSVEMKSFFDRFSKDEEIATS